MIRLELTPSTIRFSNNRFQSSNVFPNTSLWIILTVQGQQLRNVEFKNTTQYWELSQALQRGHYILTIQSELGILNQSIRVECPLNIKPIKKDKPN